MTHYLAILGMFSTLHCRSFTYIRFNNFVSNPMAGSIECELQTRCLFSECSQACRPGGAAKAPPDFGRSVNPISTGAGGRLCLPNNTGTPGFSDLPTALVPEWSTQQVCNQSTRWMCYLSRSGENPTVLYLNNWDKDQ